MKRLLANALYAAFATATCFILSLWANQPMQIDAAFILWFACLIAMYIIDWMWDDDEK